MVKLMQRGAPRGTPSDLTRERGSDDRSAAPKLNRQCEECGSSYRAASRSMDSLCPECAHQLYGYPACPHRMVAGRCQTCGWDGSVSDYVASIKAGKVDDPT